MIKNFIVTRNPKFFTPLIMGLDEYRRQLSGGVPLHNQRNLLDGHAKATTTSMIKKVDVESEFDFKCITWEDGVRFLSQNDVLALDTETTGLDWVEDTVFSIQVSNGKHNIIFDCQPHSNGRIKPEEVVGLLAGKKLIAHNMSFDGNFLQKYGLMLHPDLVGDTLLQSRILDNDETVTHNFGDVMARHLGVRYDKSEQKGINKTMLKSLKAIHYCFNDVDRLIELHDKMERMLTDRGQIKTYQLEAAHLAALEYGEHFGIPICPDRWKSKMEQDASRLAEIQQKVVDYILDNAPEYRSNGKPLDLFTSLSPNGDVKTITASLTSVPQMIKVFKSLGVDTKDAKTGKDTIGKDHLSKINHPFVRLWLNLSTENAKKTKFGSNVLKQIRMNLQRQHNVPDTIYTTFKPMVDTGRIAAGGGKDKFKQSRLNALNIEKDPITRACFKAWDGWKMIAADFEGQENVGLADWSGCPVMLESVQNGLDLHCAFARMVFPEIAPLTDGEIKKQHKDKREVVKAPRFAFAYGAGPGTVAAASGLPMALCKKLYKIFTRELHKRVFEWGAEKLQESIACGYIESVDGFRLVLPNFQEYTDRTNKWYRVPEEIKSVFYEVKKKKFEINELDNAIKEIKNCFKSQTPYIIEGADGEETKEILTESRFKLLLNRFTDQRASIVIKEDDEEIFNEWKSFYKRLKEIEGDYRKLCLNNPIQATGSRMTKAAAVRVYREILNRGHYGKALLCIMPYDEIVMCVREDLAELYQDILQTAMREEATKYLKTPGLVMKADAFIGECWQSAKSGEKFEFKF